MPMQNWASDEKQQAENLKRLVFKIVGGKKHESITQYLTQVFPFLISPDKSFTWSELSPAVAQLDSLTPEARYLNLCNSYTEWPSQMRKRAVSVKSLVTKASGGRVTEYIKVIFPKAFSDTSAQVYKEAMEKILKDLEPSAIRQAHNQRLLHLRQSLLQHMKDMKNNFVHKHSKISFSTTSSSNLHTPTGKRKSPKKKGRVSTPQPRKTLKPFIDFLRHEDYSGPAASSVKPVIIDEGKPAVSVLQLKQRKDWLITEFYQKFPSYQKRKYFSRSNLKAYWPKEFKYLRNSDGVCPLCDAHAKLARQLNKMANGFQFPEWHPVVNVPSEDDITDELPLNQLPKYRRVLKEYLEYDEHVQLAARQRRFYRNRRKPFAWPEKVLGITVDSKEPIRCGKAPGENQDRVHNMTLAAFFGLVATYRTPGEEFVTNAYFDAVSLNKDHTTYAQTGHMKNIFKDPEFVMLALKFDELEVYCDNASHFISEEFAHFVCKEIGGLFPHLKRVSMFAFAQRHGKSDCDRHFQKVAMWCREYSRVKCLEGPIDKQIIEACEIGRKKADQVREDVRGKKRIFLKVISSTLEEPTHPKKKLKVDGIQSTHGLTYLKSTGKVYDHVYPDVSHYTDGLEVTGVDTEPYERMVNGVVQDTFLLPPYAALPKLEYNPGCCKRKAANRERKMKAIVTKRKLEHAARLRKLPLLPLNR